MTDVPDLSVSVEIKQVWTWPYLGRRMAVVSFTTPLGETRRIIERKR
jgi:hypothetical protein